MLDYSGSTDKVSGMYKQTALLNISDPIVFRYRDPDPRDIEG